jgi:hypothetical protein
MADRRTGDRVERQSAMSEALRSLAKPCVDTSGSSQPSIDGALRSPRIDRLNCLLVVNLIDEFGPLCC